MLSLTQVASVFSPRVVKPESRISNKEISEMLKSLKEIKNTSINILGGARYREVKGEQLKSLGALYEIVSFAKEEVDNSSYTHNKNKKLKLTNLLTSIKHERNKCFITLNKVGKSAISTPAISTPAISTPAMSIPVFFKNINNNDAFL